MNYALVTGGGRGIGQAISFKLAAAGYFVIINYKSNQTAAEETLFKLKEFGGVGEIAQFDISNKEEIKKFYKNWKYELLRLLDIPFLYCVSKPLSKLNRMLEFLR